MAKKKKRTIARTVKRVKRSRRIVWSVAPKALIRQASVNKAKLLKRSGYSLDVDGVTQGLLTGFLACPKKTRRYLEGYRPLQTKESLVFGSLIHWLLELLARAIAKKLVKPGDGEDFFEQFIKIWLSRWLKSTEIDPQKVEFLAAQAKAIFAPYCLHWAKDDFKSSVWVEVEGAFDTVWNSTRLRGKRDAVRRFVGKRETIYRHFETKTKKDISSWLEDALLRDFQNQFYLIALNNERASLGIRKPVEEVLYNIVRRPGQKLSAKGETLSAYTARVREDVDYRPDHYFKRIKLIYTAKDIKSFEQDLLRKIEIFREWLATDGANLWKENETQCASRYRCEYLDGCLSGKMHEYHDKGRLFRELYE